MCAVTGGARRAFGADNLRATCRLCVDVPDEAQHKNGASFVASMYVCGLLDRGVVLRSPGTTEMRREQKGFTRALI